MFDPVDVTKRTTATNAIRALGSRMIISTQVLQEFFWIATKKLGMSPTAARDVVSELCESEVVPSTPSLVADAVDLSIVTGYTLWDTLIVQAAIVGRCETLLTEDLSNGQNIKGVRVENPF